jgi:hypothetical protein
VIVPKICGMAPRRTAASPTREGVESGVARRDRAVAVRDRWVAEVGVAEADGAKHGAVGRG